jgi:hypothetical protein
MLTANGQKELRALRVHCGHKHTRRGAVDKVRYARVYTDSEGESHLEDVEMDLVETNYAPPAPPMWPSAFFPASGYHFLSAPPGWYGDWHPVPRRQLFLVLKGQIEAELGDGTRRLSGPGAILVLEDTWGKGHRSWVVGDDDALMAVVVLSD